MSMNEIILYKQDKEVVEKFRLGKTQSEIARELKVSRQLIGQKLKRNGYKGRSYLWLPKREKVISVLSKSESFSYVLKELGIDEKQFNVVVKQYSIEENLSSAKRQWRKKKSSEYYLSRQAVLINKIRKLALKLGHTPRQEDLQGAISHMNLSRTFGSLPNAMIASGLVPNGHRFTAPLPKDFGDIESPTTDLDEALRRANVLRATKKEFLEPKGSKKPKQKKVTSKVYYRDTNVIAWVLNCSKDFCELCGKKGYKTYLGDFYLEVHHVIPLSLGGADTISNAVAVCETCHGKLHRAKNRDELKERLYQKIDRLKK